MLHKKQVFFRLAFFIQAVMAELADAIDLGSIGNTVQVQVLSPAPYLCNEIDAHLEKLVFTSFFCVLRAKISVVKP